MKIKDLLNTKYLVIYWSTNQYVVKNDLMQFYFPEQHSHNIKSNLISYFMPLPKHFFPSSKQEKVRES